MQVQVYNFLIQIWKFSRVLLCTKNCFIFFTLEHLIYSSCSTRITSLTHRQQADDTPSNFYVNGWEHFRYFLSECHWYFVALLLLLCSIRLAPLIPADWKAIPIFPHLFCIFGTVAISQTFCYFFTCCEYFRWQASQFYIEFIYRRDSKRCSFEPLRAVLDLMRS